MSVRHRMDNACLWLATLRAHSRSQRSDAGSPSRSTSGASPMARSGAAAAASGILSRSSALTGAEATAARRPVAASIERATRRPTSRSRLSSGRAVAHLERRRGLVTSVRHAGASMCSCARVVWHGPTRSRALTVDTCGSRASGVTSTTITWATPRSTTSRLRLSALVVITDGRTTGRRRRRVA